jgi:uncharacterized membrane protein
MRFSRVRGSAEAVQPPRRPTASGGSSAEGPKHVAQTIEEIVRLEKRDEDQKGFSDELASKITAFSGSMLYVWLHVAWFGFWILVNVAYLVFEPFDPYPFGLLTMIVSLEAIFLSTFVLITQNRQAIAADRRAKVDLQVNLIAEREITKVMEMVAHIHEHLGESAPRHDPELQEMQKPTRVEKLADGVDEAQQDPYPRSPRGPESTV